jgi:hypothetical protein
MDKLKAALLQSIDDEINSYEAHMESESELALSQDFEAKMRKLIAEMNYKTTSHSDPVKRKTVHIFGRQVRRAVLVAAVIVVLFAATITAVAIIRPEVFFNIDKDSAFWNIWPAAEIEKNDEHSIVPVMPKVPDGYSLSADDTDAVGVSLRYEDSEGHFIDYLQYYYEDVSLSIDSEGEIQETDIHGRKAVVAHHKDNSHTIIVGINEYVFFVSGDCDYEILINIVENVIKDLE